MLYAAFKEHMASGADAEVNESTVLYPATTFIVPIMVEEEISSVTVNQVGGISNYISYNPSGDSTGVGIYLLDNEINIPAANAQNIGNVNGFYSAVNHFGSGPVLSLNGMYGAAYNQGSGLVDFCFGAYGDIAVVSTGNVTTGYALYARALKIGAGAFSTAYGLYIDSIQGTSSYGVFQSDPTNGNFFAGNMEFSKTITPAGTTGNQTINKTSGTVNIAALGTTVTVTNDRVGTNSIVQAVLRTNDATARILSVVPGVGAFTINIVAATAEVSIGFLVTN